METWYSWKNLKNKENVGCFYLYSKPFGSSTPPVHIKLIHAYRNLHTYAQFSLCIHRAQVYLDPAKHLWLSSPVKNFCKKFCDKVSNTPLQGKLWRDGILEKNLKNKENVAISSIWIECFHLYSKLFNTVFILSLHTATRFPLL